MSVAHPEKLQSKLVVPMLVLAAFYLLKQVLPLLMTLGAALFRFRVVGGKAPMVALVEMSPSEAVSRLILMLLVRVGKLQSVAVMHQMVLVVQLN
jgi:hypothetical protein